jgi:DNA-binding NarL/FixJ family response regulator
MPALPPHPVARTNLPVLVARAHRRTPGVHGPGPAVRVVGLPADDRDTWQRRERRPLSPRELDVLRLVARGLTGLQIAEQLQLSESTVESHVRRAVQALGAHNRVHAVALAIGRGLIEPPSA